MEITFKLKFNYNSFDTKLFHEISNEKLELIEFKKFGHTEPTKLVYDKSNMNSFYDLWNRYLSVIIKGTNGFWFSASTSYTGIITCDGAINADSKKLSKAIDDLKKIFDVFIKSDSFLYGFIIDRDNYDLRHKVVDEHSLGWEGVSNQEFFDFLPGIYWYTAFGKEYINCIGEQKLKNLEGVVYKHSENDKIAFHLIEQLSEEKSILKELENIENQIGENYFFSKHRDVGNLHHPEGFKEFLNSLEMK